MPAAIRTVCLTLLLATVLAPALRAQEGRVDLALEEGRSGAVWDLALSPDGRILYSCGRDSTAKAWDLSSGENLRVFRASSPTLVTAVALDAAGRVLATGDMHGRLCAYALPEGRPLFDVAAHAAHVLDLAFLPDGGIVTAGRDDTLRTWNADGTPRRAFSAHSVWVNALAVTPDGVVASAGQDGSVRLWDPRTGAELALLGAHGRFARCLALAPDGRTLLSGGRDGQVRVWNVTARAPITAFATGTGFPHGLAVSGDAVLLAKTDGLIERWDWKKGVNLKSWPPESFGAMAVAVDAKGARAYSAHTAGAVRAWNASNATLLVDMVGFGDGEWLSFTRDGYFDSSPGGDRYVSWRRGAEVFPFRSYESEYRRPELLEDALAGSYTPRAGGTAVAVPPQARVTAPRDGQIFAFGSEALEIVVEVEARDARRVEGVTLALNGRTLHETQLLQRDVLLTSDTLLRLRFRIAALPGRNVLEAVALNSARVASAASRARFDVESTERRSASLFVLAVGSDGYAPHYPDLRFAEADAQALASALARQEGGMYDRVYTTVLTGRQAGRDAVLKALDAFPPMRPDDALLLFFGGHGVKARDAKGRERMYYLPAGTARRDAARNGLGWDALAARVSTLRAGRVMLLLDACHAGDVAGGVSNAKLAGALARDLGIVFASSSGSEFSFEDRTLGHGVFTAALLEGIGGKADYNGNKIVDWSELHLYVASRVRELTRDSQHPTVPRLDQFANFDLVRVP